MPTPDLVDTIAHSTDLAPAQIGRTLALLDEGNTVPFITRYRKEVTGGLDEVAIRAIQAAAERARALEARRKSVLESIHEQGRLSSELRARVEAAGTLSELEDVYLPYKRRRKTRADKARDRGLAPLAELIFAQKITDNELHARAEAFVNAEAEVESALDALEGACDIVAEQVAQDLGTRQELRELYASAKLVAKRSRLATKTERRFEDYEDFEAPLATIRHHQVLALDRGERTGQLTLRIELDRLTVLRVLKRRHLSNACGCPDTYVDALKSAWRRLLMPSLEREARARITEGARAQATAEFALNLKPLLLQRPVEGRRVLAVDPGLRTGCKLAALDEQGNYLGEATIYPIEPRNDEAGAARIALGMIQKHRLDAIAIGNGTGSRGTELFFQKVLSKAGLEVPYTIVNEAGASVYSASEIAAEEFPNLDATVRGSVSIGRRLLDPLAELVKIDARSMGVGLYQHDVDERELLRAVDAVVEDCVNYVGVDLNRASFSLLTRVSGLTAGLSRKIIAQRTALGGRFTDRKQLLDVTGLGPRTFEQAAGFLKIHGGDEILDQTAVHPESYDVARALLQRTGAALHRGGAQLPERLDTDKLARELGVGAPTLVDIAAELRRPGRDPREDLPPVIFRLDVVRMEDLKPDQWLEGTVRNVVPFGAFVDIGVKTDGLVHVSQLQEGFVENPHDVVKVGDRVRVRIVEVDRDRQRIALSMRKRSKGDDRHSGRHTQSSGKSSGSATTARSQTRKKPQGHLPFANLRNQLQQRDRG
ncbi:MAG: Tex-like N-terminal domain-containing protein [Planctomycetota bacterium]|jgi:uncharacterized protein